MTDLEKIINIYTSKIFVSIPCKIEKLNGMYADVKPLIYDALDFPVISSVPILFIGNSNKKLKFKSAVGDNVTVFFTQLDLGKFLASGSTGQVNSNERFNLTNAFALPFNIHTKTDSETTAIADFDIIGDLNITGNVNLTGNIIQTGTYTNGASIITPASVVSTTLSGTAGVSSSGLDFDTHVHPYTDNGNQMITGGPE